MKSITVDGVEYVPAAEAQSARRGDAPYVIVRCEAAGVHAGYLARRDDAHRIAELVDARRLWRWHGRTLSGLALEGTDDPALCKFGDPVSITLAGWCEIIQTTPQAQASLEAVARWVND